MFRELVEKNRSYRRFRQTPAVTRADLEDLVDTARIAASGGNLQPLSYFLSADEKSNASIFGLLRWAGYLTDWDGPVEGERPTGYIVILRNNEVTTNFIIDHGIAAEVIRLAAAEKGWGSCIMGSLDRQKMRESLGIPTAFEILLVIAVGTPGETIRLEKIDEDGNIKYWRDEKQVMHVPKRALKDVIIN